MCYIVLCYVILYHMTPGNRLDLRVLWHAGVAPDGNLSPPVNDEWPGKARCRPGRLGKVRLPPRPRGCQRKLDETANAGAREAVSL